MSEHQDDEVYTAKDDAKTFDIYHLRSRWSVALAALAILVLLLMILYYVFSSPQVV